MFTEQKDSLFIEPVKTVITEVDIVHSIKQAYHILFGYDVSLDTLSILCAQIFLETGRGKSCYNFNLGNVKRTKNHKWTWFKCGERINGIYQNFIPPHYQTHFAAYDSLTDAAVEHLKFLNKPRYQASLQEANCGNPEAYCEQLHKAGYYTATVEQYKKALVPLFEEIRTKYKDEAIDDPYC